MAAPRAELERRRRVLGGKDLLHGRLVRFQAAEHPVHFFENDPETGSELAVERGTDDPAIHKLEHAGHFAHHSPARIPGTWIDADDGDGLRHEKWEGRDSRVPSGTRFEEGGLSVGQKPLGKGGAGGEEPPPDVAIGASLPTEP